MSTDGSFQRMPLADFVALTEKARLSALRAMAAPGAALCDYGDTAEKLASTDVSAALANTQILESAAVSLGDARALARVRRARVLSLAYSGAYAEALALGELARADALAAGERIEAARALIAQMQPLLVTGRAEDALTAGATAGEELLSLGEPVLAARVDINLGNIHKALGQPARALACLDAAAAVLASQPDLAAHIDIARGESLLMLDRFEEARAAFQKSLTFFAVPAGQVGMVEAVVEGNLADLSARQGGYQSALEGFARARAALGSAPSAHAARLLVEEGEVFEMLGVTDVAGDRFAKGSAEFDRLGMAYESLRAAVGQGRVLASAGELSSAAECFGSAAERAEALGNAPERSKALLQQASSLARAGSIAMARATLERVDQSALVGPVDRVMAHLHASVVAERAGTLAVAMSEIDSALEQAAVAGVAPIQAEVLTHQATLLRRSARPADAARAARRAVDLVEHVRGSLQAERTRAGLLGRRLGAYEELVAALVADGSSVALEEAFAVAERAKSRTLLDRMRQALDEPGASTIGPHAVELNALRRKLDGLYARIVTNSKNDTRYGITDEVRLEVGQIEARIGTLEGERVSGSLRPFCRGAVSDIHAISGSIAPETGLVSYFRARGRWLAFVHVGGSTSVVDLACNDDALSDSLNRVGFQIRRALVRGVTVRQKYVDDSLSALDHLAELVWTPIAPMLKGVSDVVVVAHGLLHTVPFHALRHEGRFMIEDHAVGYAPSAGVYADLIAREPRTSYSNATRVIGVPDAAAPRIEDEARAVAAVVGDRHPLIGSDATRDAVKRVLTECESVHLACHGFFLPEAPRASGLKLADGWLTARDIAELERTPSTVVLSGCETAATAVRDGDELLGLAGAFLGGGTKQIIATLWPIQDSIAAVAMADFHARSTDPRGRKPRATHVLRENSLLLMERTPHPAHWASFIAIGA